MTIQVGVVIDPWDFPFNGTVVSTRRFVAALSSQINFHLLATPDTDIASDERMQQLPRLSIPGFNSVINSMKVPLANPWAKGVNVEETLKDVDIVHVQFPFFLGYSACRAANRLGLPLICSFHVQPENLLRNLGLESSVLVNALYRLFIWGLYSRAQLVLTPSQFAADQLIEHGLKTPIEVLSNGVPKEFFDLERLPPCGGKLEILSVGRLAPEKHQHSILEAVSRSKFRDQIQIRMVGTGPLQEKLEIQAAQLGLCAEIGPVDDAALRRCYQTADLFVHGGEIELEGMSVLEAMAAGNAVLVSDSVNSATMEFVTEEDSRFRQGDVFDLTIKIDRWLSDPEARKSAGADNRERAFKRHHQRSVDQLLQVYERYARGATSD